MKAKRWKWVIGTLWGVSEGSGEGSQKMGVPPRQVVDLGQGVLQGASQGDPFPALLGGRAMIEEPMRQELLEILKRSEAGWKKRLQELENGGVP